MRKNPNVSVILPAYNGEKYIQQAIDCVLDQSFTEFELIIIDDCSQDQTWELISDYNDSRIKKTRNEINKGVAETTNKAVMRSRGSVLAFLDQDDIWTKHKLREHMKTHSNDGCEIVYTDHFVIDPEGNKLREIEHPEPAQTSTGLINQICTRGNIIDSMSCATIKKSAWLDIGGFDSQYTVSGDIDLWLRLAEDNNFSRISEFLTGKRLHSNNLSKKYEIAYDENKQIANKYRDKRLIPDTVYHSMINRITLRRAKQAFYAKKANEAVCYSARSLQQRIHVEAIAVLLLSLADFLSGPLRIGQKMYNVYDLVKSYNV